MRADPSEETITRMDLESESVEHIDTCFPPVFVTLHLFDSERRVMNIIKEELDLVFKFFLSSFR